jgi:2-polyprenyl-6-methoxyphenol hydroxylase-like FAD-dependent oxidoreductase
MASASPRVVIVGAGPAGMMLAYQLASNGVAVRVLERHPDFEREFRGELIQASVLAPLERSGILRLLLARGLAIPDVERRMFVGRTRAVRPPGPPERGALISQPGLLALLHELASRYPGYRLDFGATAQEAIREGGRVVAIKARRERAEERVEGDLFVISNGRNSALRKSCGLEAEIFQSTANALWLRFDFSDAEAALPRGVDVHMFGKGVVVVLFPVTGKRLQIAYSAPGDMGGLKRDLPELRRRLLPALSDEMRPLIDAKLNEETESQVLKIIVDRLVRWHAPGALFIGDAAHTMSPSGGQGLNLAIRDTFVAANHLIPAIRAGQPLDEALLQRIEDERRPEIDAIQAVQTRVGQMVMKPAAVLHLMFTALRLVMALAGKRMQAGGGVTAVEARHLTPADQAPAR